jgi:glycosyltransferase involved in cell wall biosynthesis
MVPLITKNYDAYIILSDTRSISGWFFVLLSKLYPNKKVYYWSHGWYGKESKLEKFIKKILYKLPNGGTFLYGNYARSLMIKEGFNPNKLFTIHNSLPYEKQLSIRESLSESTILSHHFGNYNPNLIFTGRLTPVKKLDMIIKAISILKRKGKIYNLTIIGDGEMKVSLQQLVEELDLKDNVWFFGACYDECELGNLLYNADLCVSPGNVGLTAMHALVFGCPVITHNNFAMQMPEFEAVKDGITGTFFEYGNIESLSFNIEKWIETNHGERDKIRANCMDEIDRYWTPQFQIDVIKQVLENENASH